MKPLSGNARLWQGCRGTQRVPHPFVWHMEWRCPVCEGATREETLQSRIKELEELTEVFDYE